jgi:hypothetical protein
MQAANPQISDKPKTNIGYQDPNAGTATVHLSFSPIISGKRSPMM